MTAEPINTTPRARSLRPWAWLDMVCATGDLLPWETLEGPPQERGARAFARYELTANHVRASLVVNGRSMSGRATNASVNGLFIESRAELTLGQAIRVDLSASNGEHRHFDAKVARVTEAGFGVHLTCNDSTAAFRARFVEQARSPGAEPPAVMVQALPSSRRLHGELETNAAQLRQLHSMWAHLEVRLEEDGAHQSFIHACLGFEKLEYALARYRELAELRPDLPAAQHYLSQLGTILTFANGSTSKTRENFSSWQSKVFMLLAAVSAIVIAALWVAQVSSASQLAKREAAVTNAAVDEAYVPLELLQPKTEIQRR